MDQAAALAFDDDELTREAVAEGARLNVGGSVINAAMKRAPLRSVRTVDPSPAPSPQQLAPVGGLTEQQVRQLIDDRDEMWRAHSESLQRQIDILAARLALPRTPPTYVLQASYLENGAIAELVARPQVNA